MKQIIRIIFLSFMTLPLFIACEKVQYDMPTISGGARLSIDFTKDTTFAFSYEENTSSLAFKSNYTWVAELDEQASPWLKFSQLNGKPGTHDVSFSLTQNDERDTRYGRITLYMGDTSIVITIKQNPGDFILERDEEGNIKSATIYLDGKKQDTSYTFYANVEWTAIVNEAAEEWLHTEDSGIKDETKLTISVEKNKQAERTGTITVLSSNHSFEIQVIQAKVEDEFDYNNAQTTLAFPYSKSEKTFSFNARVDWTVTLSEEDAAWISVDQESGTAGGIELKVTAEENLNFVARMGQITITGEDSTFILNVTQDAYPAFTFTSSVTEFSFPFSGGTQTFEFFSNVDEWTAEVSSPFSVTPNKGTYGSCTITISCEAGDDRYGRMGVGRVLYLRGGGQTRQFNCRRGTTG